MSESVQDSFSAGPAGGAPAQPAGAGGVGHPATGVRYNLVTFTPDNDPAAVLFLKLESAWTRRVGLKPDINRAIVPYTQADKLKGDFDRVGTIRFYYRSKTDPDVELRGERIIAAEPLLLRQVAGKGLINAEYRLHFSDFREQYIEPRGGRLTLGVINPSAKPNGKNAPGTEMSLADMVAAATVQMGLGELPYPNGVDVDPPRDVKWLGNHAPTELGNLLSLAGIAFVPELDGKTTLQRITPDGTPPGLPASERLPDQLTPQLDRRGASVVFSSFPSRVIYTLSETQDDGWNFVAQDKGGSWAELSKLDLLAPYGGDADACVRDSLAHIDPKFRERLQGQLFRCIQANQAVPAHVSPVLARRFEADGLDYEIQVLATIAQYNADGTWSNAKGDVNVPVLQRDAHDVLYLAQPLGKVSAANVHDANRSWAGPAKFTVRFSYEGFVQDPKSKSGYRYEYFHLGYVPGGVSTSGGGSGVQAVSEAEVLNAIDGKAGRDGLIITRPAWRLLNIDGKAVNLADFKARAEAEASNYLKNAGKPARVLGARGFAPVAPSGLVTEVAWDQSGLRTTVKVCDWYLPNGALQQNRELAKLEAGGQSSGGGGAGGEYPHQAATEAGRTAIGAAGATQPVTVISPAHFHNACNALAVHLADFDPKCGGLYTCRELSGNPDTIGKQYDSGPVYTLPAGMTESPLDSAAILLSLEEVNLTGHRLDVNGHAAAVLIGYDKVHKRDVCAIVGGKGKRNGPIVLPPSSPTVEPDPTDWHFDTDARPLVYTFVSRLWWDVPTNILYQFTRQCEVDAMGKLYHMSGETRTIVDTSVAGCA